MLTIEHHKIRHSNRISYDLLWLIPGNGELTWRNLVQKISDLKNTAGTFINLEMFGWELLQIR